MTNLRKTTLAALAVATLATGGIFAAPAASNAMTGVRVAPVEATATTEAIKVGHRHHRHHRHWRHRYGYGYGHHCFWIKKKFWDEYYGGYFWKPIKVCR